MDTDADYSRFSMPTASLGIGDPGAVEPIPLDSSTAANGSAGDGAGAPIADGEPLVDAGRVLHCLNCYHRAGWSATSATTWLRRGVVARLVAIEQDLPDGFGIAVYDGWRSPDTVRALHDHYYGSGSTLPPGYLADPDATADVPPPHLTGGAVDLTLTWDGAPLSLGTHFDEFTDRSHLHALEGATTGPDVVDRDLRRLLHRAMTDAGFAGYDQEWWHFSYGDDAWARAHGTITLYAATVPGGKRGHEPQFGSHSGR